VTSRGRLTALLAGAATVALVCVAGALATTRGEDATVVVPDSGAKPAWSPNGAQVAFAELGGQPGARSWRLVVVGANGSGRRQLLDLGRDAPQSISWSLDGSRLAYDALSTSDQDTAVYTIAAAGGQASKVALGWAPSWGPGNRLLIVQRTGDAADNRMAVVNADGSGRTELPPCPEAEIGSCVDSHPDWSADGGKIAFDTIRGELSAVWTMSADGSNLRVWTSFADEAGHPRWSQDAGQMVFVRYGGDASSGGDVVIMNADGSGSRVVVKDGSFPDLSPDGRTIVFVRGSSLFLVNTDGSNVRELTATVTTTPPTVPPVLRRCVVPKLAGRTLAAARTALRKANCKTGKVTRVKSKRIKNGRVISSKPKAGTTRPNGAAVALVVSRGPR
jgi:Tol biopolymer transport system component